MSDNTHIEWADATVNAVNGCSVISPGCTNCYAMKLAGTRLRDHPSRAGLTNPSKAGPVWNGEVTLHNTALHQPRKWARPRTIFWNAHGDLFHENVPDDWIDQVFDVIRDTPQHKHLVLTKRTERMKEYLRDLDRPPLPLNVWIGTSVEDQQRAEERIPHLLDTPARGRFISAEPLLGFIHLLPYLITGGIHGVIAGGESGTGARPMHPSWARAIQSSCEKAGVPFHFKQWGSWRVVMERDFGDLHASHQKELEALKLPNVRWLDTNGGQVNNVAAVLVQRVQKKLAGRVLDGRLHDALPWNS